MGEKDDVFVLLMNGTNQVIDLTILEGLDTFKATPVRSSYTIFDTLDKTIINYRIRKKEVNKLIDIIRKISINFDVVYHCSYQVHVF